MGSKNLIAEKIINVLPKVDTFVDLFGGGGAMTHCACLSGKFKHFYYNDKNKMIYDLFKQAVNAPFDFNFNNYPWINRKQFGELKGVHPYYTYTYSFNGKGTSYGFNEEKEQYDGEMYKKYAVLPIKIKQNNFRLNCLRELKKYGISILNLDYTEVLNDIINITDYYKPKNYSIVVYCDIPYEKTTKYVEKKFDNKSFYEYIYNWGLINHQYVFISSYEINDYRFIEYTSWTKRIDFGTKRDYVTEKLFVPDYLLNNLKNTSGYQLSLFDILDNK